jgi:hypothetical protein
VDVHCAEIFFAGNDDSTWPAPELLKWHNEEFEALEKKKMAAAAGPAELPEDDRRDKLRQVSSWLAKVHVEGASEE